MKRWLPVVALVAIVASSLGADLFACGDKFLVLGRGTRYQRPKNARAANVLIYADPASALTASLKKSRAESLLKQEGHRAITVQTADQLEAQLAGGRFDVVLASRDVAPSVEKVLASRAALVTVDDRPKGQSLLEAIDKAVEQRDKNVRKRT